MRCHQENVKPGDLAWNSSWALGDFVESRQNSVLLSVLMVYGQILPAPDLACPKMASFSRRSLEVLTLASSLLSFFTWPLPTWLVNGDLFYHKSQIEKKEKKNQLFLITHRGFRILYVLFD
jgi:hypothetical protein